MISLVADVFPAVLNTDDGTFDTVRVLSDGATLWAFRLSGNEVGVATSFPVRDLDLDPTGIFTATNAETGTAVSFRTAGGCGCGNPLKRQSVETLLALVPA